MSAVDSLLTRQVKRVVGHIKAIYGREENERFLFTERTHLVRI